MKEEFKSAFTERTQFLFCGNESYWFETKVSSIRHTCLTEPTYKYSIADLGINVFCSCPPKIKSKNRLSPFIQIGYAGKSILCTGDSEGINFNLLFQRSLSLKPIIFYQQEKPGGIGGNLMKSFKDYISNPDMPNPEESGFQAFTKSYFSFYSDAAPGLKMLKLESIFSLYLGEGAGFTEENKIQLMCRLIMTEKTRKVVKNADVVILPHHGTQTENSQRLLGYLGGRREHKQLFIVSSTSFGRNGIPKASTIEMTPALPRIFEHPFSYCRDDLGKQVQVKITTKPILLTQMADYDFQCVKITHTGQMAVLRKAGWYEFPQRASGLKRPAPQGFEDSSGVARSENKK